MEIEMTRTYDNVSMFFFIWMLSLAGNDTKICVLLSSQTHNLTMPQEEEDCVNG